MQCKIATWCSDTCVPRQRKISSFSLHGKCSIDNMLMHCKQVKIGSNDRSNVAVAKSNSTIKQNLPVGEVGLEFYEPLVGSGRFTYKESGQTWAINNW